MDGAKPQNGFRKAIQSIKGTQWYNRLLLLHVKIYGRFIQGLKHYTANPQLKCDPGLSIFKHIQEVFEDSSTTLSSVVPIPYLSSQQRHKDKIVEDSRSFSAKQVEALLVMAFFCTFPYRNSDGEMPGINFNTLYEAMN